MSETQEEEFGKFIIDDEMPDQELQSDGVWMEYDKGLELKIASIQNKDCLKEIRKLQRGKRNVLDKEDDKAKEAICKILAKHVVKDWKGVYYRDESGAIAEQKYTAGACYDLLLKVPDIQVWVTDKCTEAEFYKVAAREESLGN